MIELFLVPYKTNLKTRLDKEKQEVTAQLQQTVEKSTFEQFKVSTNQQLADKAEEVYVEEINTLPMENVNRKLALGENVLIHCVGDSTTFGAQYATSDENTYVGYLARLMAQKYPNYTVERYDGDYTNADGGITSWTKVTVQTGTGTGKIVITRNGIGVSTLLKIFNRSQDYLNHFTQATPYMYPDLVIYFGGINDSLTGVANRYVPAENYKEGLKAFIQLIKTRHGKCDIALMSPNWANPFESLSPYRDAIAQVAQYEGVSYVDIHKIWLDHYVVGAANYGQGNWLGADPYHPTDLGYEAIANECFRVLFKDNIRSNRRNNGIKNITYQLGLSTLETFVGTWTNGTVNYGNEIAYTEKRSSVAGDTVTIPFKGNKIYLLTRKDATGCVLSVSVDGITPQSVSLQNIYPTDKTTFVSADKATFPQEKVLLWENLTDGDHTLVITITSGTFNYGGVEVVTTIKNTADVISGTNIPMVVNKKTIAGVATGTGANFYIDVVFDKPHFVPPVVQGIAYSLGMAVIADASSITTTGCLLYGFKTDGSSFTGANVTIGYYAIG